MVPQPLPANTEIENTPERSGGDPCGGNLETYAFPRVTRGQGCRSDGPSCQLCVAVEPLGGTYLTSRGMLIFR